MGNIIENIDENTDEENTDEETIDENTDEENTDEENTDDINEPLRDFQLAGNEETIDDINEPLRDFQLAGNEELISYNTNDRKWKSVFVNENINSRNKFDQEVIYVSNNVSQIDIKSFYGNKKLRKIVFGTINNPQTKTVNSSDVIEINSSSPMNITRTISPPRPFSSNNCFYLEDINSQTLTICISAFEDCENLEIVEFIDNFKKVQFGNCCFRNCKALKKFIFPNNTTFIGNGMFDGCLQLSQVQLFPPVRIIPSEFFSMCQSLTSIELPKTVEILQDRVFENSGLKSLFMTIDNDPSLSNVDDEPIVNEVSFVSVGINCFANCHNLTNIHFTDKLEKLGRETFVNCINLETVRLSDKIKKLPRGIFRNCESLKNVNIPKSLTKISPESFRNTKVIIDSFDNVVDIDYELITELTDEQIEEGVEDTIVNSQRKTKSKFRRQLFRYGDYW